MRTILIFSLICVSFALNGCKKNILDEDKVKTTVFFPFPNARIQIFEVDSFLFKVTSTGLDIDTLRYRVSEQWIDTSITMSDTCYTVLWEAKSLDQADNNYQGQRRYCLSDSRLSESNENTNVITLILPPILFKSWNGLALFNANTYTEQIRDEPIQPYRRWGKFSIQSTNDSIYLGGELHTNLVRVLHVNMENAVEKRFSYSLWKENVGLLYTEKWILDTQKISNESWTTKAEKGYIVKMKRIL
jgi:hypothetical protein